MAVVPVLFSCKPKEDDLGEPRLTLDPMELALEQGESAGTVQITSTRAWLVYSCPDWLALSPQKGPASTKPQTVTVSANANPGFDRTGTIVISNGFDRLPLTVSQKGTQGELKTGSGTLEDPYTVAGVIAYVQSLGKDVQSPSRVYFKGIVDSVETTFEGSGNYGNAIFYLVDNKGDKDRFYCFQTLYLGGNKWKKGDTEIKEGDNVIVYGLVVNYKGNTPETVSKGESYVYSLNGVTGGEVTPVQPGTPSGSGTQADPYNVAAACKAVSGLTWTNKDNYQKVGPYYVKGKVSAIDQDYTYNVSDGRTYGNARFSISDTGEASGAEQFTLFNLYYLGNDKFKAGQTDIKVGDDVVIYAELMNYHNDTPENSGGYLYSLNGDTGAGQPSETITGTVKETIAAADGTGVVINEAQVAAISKQGLIVTDGTANVYLFFDSKKNETVPAVKIGDKVKVEATKDTYGGIPEFKSAKVTVISSGSTFNYPEPKDITPIAASYKAGESEFIQMTGTLIIDGNYYNIEFDGVDSQTKMGSISAPLESLGASSYNGKKVTVTGYFTGLVSSGKFISMVAVSIAPADPNAKYCTVEPAAISVKADATSASFSVKANAAWTAVSDNADFTLSPASGEGDATVTVSFAANSGDAAKVANIKVSCPDAGVETTVVLTQAKPSSGEALVITADFTIETSALPQGSTEGLKDGTFTVDGYTFTFHAADKYYQAKSNDKFYLLIGKTDSYVQFPAVEGKSLVKVEFLTGAAASENVIGDIAKADGTRLNVNNDKLLKGTKYEWSVAGEPGAAYRFVVTNKYNAQFQTLTLTYE